ncbi:Extracellular calcium-sensing receptor [Bagarius yarrelli]|uniref:Extracellular calcium-sensing receptor n=1 Tax=Bagarius yarrelli TaxID=175774 RepID=A0A556TQM5_BAGYA|nr:Extracellular calcium-sensing receptor [Bagarius yarrelli]
MLGNMPVGELALVAICLLLWLQVQSSESSSECQRIGEFDSHALELDGDVILGGLFPMHYQAPEPDHVFTDRPQFQRCSGFDLRAFRWVQTMVFAIEEINSNPRILPGVKLGYRILDCCDHVHTSLQSAFSLVNGSSSYYTDSSANRSFPCMSKAPVPAIIGLASSTPTRAVAHTFSPFEIPLISAITDALEASTARVIVVFATEGQLLELLSEVAMRNLTGWQWVASEAWVTASVLTAPVFQHVLTGTLGFSFRGMNISGLAEFLLKVRPSDNPGSVFTNMFWEEQFNCRLNYAKRAVLDRPHCTGLENLEEVESSYTSVTPVRVSYNVYKAVYAIAYALHDLLQCTFTTQASDQSSCNTGTEFTPGQPHVLQGLVRPQDQANLSAVLTVCLALRESLQILQVKQI